MDIVKIIIIHISHKYQISWKAIFFPQRLFMVKSSRSIAMFSNNISRLQQSFFELYFYLYIKPTFAPKTYKTLPQSVSIPKKDRCLQLSIWKKNSHIGYSFRPLWIRMPLWSLFFEVMYFKRGAKNSRQ